MTDAMDWSDLAAQKLPSLGATGGAHWNRPLHDSTPPRTSTNAPFQSAVVPSTGLTVPSIQAGSSVGSASVSGTLDPVREGLSSRLGHWEDHVAQREQQLIETIVQRAESKTRKKIDAVLEQQLQKAWKQEREQWINDILGTAGAIASSPLRVQQLQEGPTSQLPLLLPQESHTSPSVFPQRTAASLDRLDSRVVQAHLEIISSSNTDMALTAAKLGTVAVPPGDLSSAYQLMWYYIEELAKMRIEAPTALQQSVAYLTFLCKQTQTYIINRVRAASLAGNPVVASAAPFQNSMATTCASFAKLVVGESEPPASWPVAYFCLRCGDAAAAGEVLVGMGLHQSSEPSAGAVLRLVKSMSLAQGGKACVWEGESIRLDANGRQTVAVLLESARNREQQDVYEIGFYTLCCATDVLPTPENVFGFSSVEDYMCGALWKAICAAQPKDELVSFGDTIAQFGVSYFGENLVPFLVAQQYETLLGHLANDHGRIGLLYGAHLGLVLARAGVNLRNLTSPDSRSSLDASLIVAYSNLLLADESFGLPAALEYLARIATPLRARQEVAALVAKTGRTDQLVGKLDEEGYRRGPGLMDKYFSSNDIADILSMAASQLLRDESDRNKMSTAVLCLSLAEKFGDALGLMGKLLSPPETPDALRGHWLDQAETFYTSFLSKRTHVVDVLDRGNQTAIIGTLRTLIDLNRFFQLCRANKKAEAWGVLESMGLLPMSQEELSSKADEFPRLDPLLKDAYPAVVATAVEMLHVEYNQTLHSSPQWSPSQSVMQGRLQNMKETIRTISSFTSIAGVPLSREQLESVNRISSLLA